MTNVTTLNDQISQLTHDIRVAREQLLGKQAIYEAFERSLTCANREELISLARELAVIEWQGKKITARTNAVKLHAALSSWKYRQLGIDALADYIVELLQQKETAEAELGASYETNRQEQAALVAYQQEEDDPTVLTQEVEIDGRTYTVCGRTQEEVTQEVARIEQEVNAMWEEVARKEQGVTEAWLEHCKKLDEQQALQGVASFLSSLAVFASHDIKRKDVVGDVELYRELKSKWDAMGGDALCQCDWCDANPLQYQEELQHTIALHAHVVLQQNPLSYVDILPEGNITISTQDKGTVSLSAREAYNLLETLYQAKDVLYQAVQQNESEPAQKLH